MPKTQDVGGVVADAGVDWLRVTFDKQHPHIDEIGLLIRSEQRELSKLGIPTEPKNWYGYQGLSVEKLFIGETDERVMVQATSGAAKHCFDLLRPHASSVKCARIDAQVTTQHATDQKYFASNCKDEIRRWEARRGVGRQMDLRPWERAKFGDSLYIGSPTSDWATIIYDKTREQKGALEGWFWRREIKAQRKRAQAVFQEAVKWSDQEQFSRSLLATRLQSFGLDEEWMKDNDRVELPSQRKMTTDEQDLAYYHVYHTKKIQNLIRRGLGFELLANLGLETIDGALCIVEPSPRADLAAPEPTPIGAQRPYRNFNRLPKMPFPLPHHDDDDTE